jgi:hypothetical protein
VIFPFIGRFYCEVECLNGSVDLSATRYHATPLIIREKESASAFLHRGTSELISEFSPPHGVEYYSRGVSGSSRLFEWFDFKRTSWPDPGGWSYTRVQVPYWLFVVFFAIAPVCWLARRACFSPRTEKAP